MLTINGVPVDVMVPQRTRPSIRWPRDTDCRPANGKYEQRAYGGSNFARPGPKPTPVMERKWRESRARLELKRLWWEAEKASWTTPPTVDAPPPAVPAAVWPRTEQRATQTSLGTGRVGEQTGRDMSTQVDECALPDAEAARSKQIELLVAATLERAEVEVLARDRVAALRRDRAVYESRQLADRFELNRLEHVEGLRRQRAVANAERAHDGHAYRAVHSVAMAGHCMAGVRADALGRLEAAGYLLAENQETAARVRDRIGTERIQLDALISDAIANRPAAVVQAVVKHTGNDI